MFTLRAVFFETETRSSRRACFCESSSLLLSANSSSLLDAKSSVSTSGSSFVSFVCGTVVCLLSHRGALGPATLIFGTCSLGVVICCLRLAPFYNPVRPVSMTRLTGTGTPCAGRMLCWIRKCSTQVSPKSDYIRARCERDTA